MAYKLGKKPARNAIGFSFADYFDASKLPTPPSTFGHHTAVSDFHMLGNDLYGCCVWSGAAHEHYIWSLEGGRERVRITTADVLSDYAAATGFDPAKPDTDQGSDIKDAASYRRKTGIIDANGRRHQIDSYVALKIGNVEELALATWLTGAVGIGLQIPNDAQDQFEAAQPWSVSPGAPRIEGGHYVPVVGRNESGNFLVVTWGKIQEMTPEFYGRFSDEAIGYLSIEILDAKNLSPEGFDADALRGHLANL